MHAMRSHFRRPENPEAKATEQFGVVRMCSNNDGSTTRGKFGTVRKRKIAFVIRIEFASERERETRDTERSAYLLPTTVN